MTITELSTPIEVWLTQANLTVNCTVVNDDESTVNLDIESLSLRGAQREITGYLLGKGYQAVGRWTTEAGDDDTVTEVSRKFR